MIFIMYLGRKALPHCSSNMPCSNTRIKLTKDIKTAEARQESQFSNLSAAKLNWCESRQRQTKP